jgi:hypothetical protein
MDRQPRENVEWHVLVNDGYRYCYDRTIWAPTAKAARKLYLELLKGDWRTQDFRVKRGRRDVDRTL